jgi:hypothetical protein
MNHEKIFKRADGSSVLISVSVSIEWSSNEPYWSRSVHVRAKGKRRWSGVYDQYTPRGLSQPEREKLINEAELKHCTPDEVLQVKMDLWEKIKPT